MLIRALPGTSSSERSLNWRLCEGGNAGGAEITACGLKGDGVRLILDVSAPHAERAPNHYASRILACGGGNHRREFDFGMFSFLPLFFSKRKAAIRFLLSGVSAFTRKIEWELTLPTSNGVQFFANHYTQLKLRTSWVIIFLIAVSGCAPSVSEKLTGKSVTPESVYQSVRENQERVRSMRGEGRITVETPEIAQSASFVLMLRKPDSMLVEIEGPFGISVGSALLTRNEFLFYNSIRNQLISGSMSAANLSRIFRLRLTFDELVNLFTGGTFLAEDQTKPDEFAAENDLYVLTYYRSDGNRRYWVDPVSLLIERIQLFDRQEKLIFEQRFDNFHAVEGTKVPYNVRLTQHKEHRQVALSYSTVLVNTDAVQFTLNVPDNAERVRWQ